MSVHTAQVEHPAHVEYAASMAHADASVADAWLADAPVPDAPVADAVLIRAHRRRVAGRVLRWAVLLVALGMLIRFMSIGWPEIRASLSLLTAQRLPLVGLAVVAEMMWVFAMSQVYRSALMAFDGTVSRLTVLRISMAAFTLSRILPGGGAAGGVVAARELIALGNPGLSTVISMLASWWITMTGLSALSFAGIAVSIAGGVLPVRYLAVPSIALAAFVAGGVAISMTARSPQWRGRLSAIVSRLTARLGPQVVAAVGTDSVGSATARVHRGGLLVVFGWGLLVWITDATALWLSLAAFGWRVDIGVLLVAYGVANLISSLPELTPGWLGVLEASVAVTLSAFGVPNGIATVAVLVYRLLSYWLPTAAGIPAATSVLGGHGRRSRATQRPSQALGLPAVAPARVSRS